MQARVVARVVLWLSAAAMSAGVLASDAYTPPTSDAFLKSIRSYPFIAAAARREKIRTGVPQLTRCMPSTEVRSLIGNPDFGFVAYRQGTNGTLPSMKLWNYVLEKKGATEIEPGSRVVVWFDPDGRVQAVTVHGASDIESTVSRRNQECPGK